VCVTDICKLNLRRLDISSNRVQKIPTVFRKLEVLEEIILEHNPLLSPPAHVSLENDPLFKSIFLYCHS
jgi:Leucine-rich repeat (LRR) protein